MSWAADLFYLLCGAASVPASEQHTVARTIVLAFLLVGCVVAGVAMLAAVWAADGDRMHLPTRRRIGKDLASCIRTAKEV